jgi:hypothetical protein
MRTSDSCLQLTGAKILNILYSPVGVLIVDDKEGETAVLVIGRPASSDRSSCPRHSCTCMNQSINQIWLERHSMIGYTTGLLNCNSMAFRRHQYASLVKNEPERSHSLHKSPPFLPILSQMNPIHAIPCCFYERHLSPATCCFGANPRLISVRFQILTATIMAIAAC